MGDSAWYTVGSITLIEPTSTYGDPSKTPSSARWMKTSQDLDFFA
jgi:hypothetical protein